MRKKTGISLVALAVLVFVFSSCFFDKKKTGWEYMPDMVHAQSDQPYSVDAAFPDSSEARLPVAGTIPRGVYMPFHYPNTPEGFNAAGKEVKCPIEATPENLAEGQRLFNIYCAICHGEDGAADGTIVKNGKFPAPPSYFTNEILAYPIGKMFFVVHYGRNLMGSYASQLNQEQIWKVLSYVKSMQKAYVNKTGGSLPDSIKVKYKTI
jgi:mono/diheme cytochrome c family protein